MTSVHARTVTELGAIVRRRRRQHGLTQAALAATAGIARSTLIDIESGKDTTELALALRVLGALDLVADIVPAPTVTGPVDLWEMLDDA